MPHITAMMEPFQSQGGFRVNLGSGTVYREAALVAASNIQTGRGETIVEVQRRLPGWTYNEIGQVSPSSGAPSQLFGTGGTSFVDGVIDPTLTPGSILPLSGNNDPRFIAGTGQLYGANLDTQIAATKAVTDYYLHFQYFQTYDTQRPKGQSFYNQVLAHWLQWNFMASKYQATGKPFALGVVLPGLSTGGNAYAMAAMHEAVHHLAVNGRRSSNPLLAGFPVIPSLYILATCNAGVAFDDAREADNVAIGTDRIHPSQASSIRIGRQMAATIAKIFAPEVAQEYDGPPYIVNAWVKESGVIRVRIKITANNRLVWKPRPTEDATAYTLEGGGSTFPEGAGHIMVTGHKFYQPRQVYHRWRPWRLPVTTIAVDNTAAATGYAFLDLTVGKMPTLGTCVSIQPSQSYRHYWRQEEAIDPSLKLLSGLREEAGGSAYDVSAACEDVLIAGRTFMSVLPAISVPVAAEDPGV